MFEFQSLFYWITYSYLEELKEQKEKEEKFQSLFYWITYPYKNRKRNSLKL